MEKLHKEMEERLKYLESQEQTEEIKIRINEITLAIVHVQNARLKNIINNKICDCKHPRDAFDGTGTCINCRRKIPIDLSSKQQINSGLNQYKSKDEKLS